MCAGTYLVGFISLGDYSLKDDLGFECDYNGIRLISL